MTRRLVVFAVLPVCIAFQLAAMPISAADSPSDTKAPFTVVDAARNFVSPASLALALVSPASLVPRSEAQRNFLGRFIQACADDWKVSSALPPPYRWCPAPVTNPPFASAYVGGGYNRILLTHQE